MIKCINDKIKAIRVIIDLNERKHDLLIDDQTKLDEDSANGLITDGEYLSKCNENLLEVKKTKKEIKSNKKELVDSLTRQSVALKMKIEMLNKSDSFVSDEPDSDSDSDDEPFIGPARRFTFENQNW